MSIAPRILYVDDDQAGCDLMVYWLRKEYGCDVTTATDGQEARKLIEQEFFDLYLLDYCLPDVTAVNLCEEIRRTSRTAPIIVYSALDREIDKLHALGAGADHYFVKPEQMDLIGIELKRIFGWPAEEKRTEARAITLSDPASVGHLHRHRKASGIV